ncbi:MAG: ral nucleoside transport system ATP-binding protein [Desulfonauticus sp.]|jgi:simple sugar transport system ATP-binding protein|nr:MAG: ABC transporter related [Desulfonauticus sp. 38_4375]MDK2920481.1 ral nucleoside transport system ATP-binding protein [Desulfonauticus sp.]
MQEPILRLSNIGKSFGDFWANENINLDIFPGEIHALLGENGAGKSTLMSIISGNYLPDKGKIYLKGKEVFFRNPKIAQDYGIGMVHQKFMLIDNLSVWENIALGTISKFTIPKEEILNKIQKISKESKLEVDLHKKVINLSEGEKQKVEILKLLYKQAKILIFDEPTSILTPQEIDSFFEILLFLKKRKHTIIFITHKLEEVFKLADRISILRKGRLIATFLPQEIRSKKELARLMVGRDIVFKVDKEEIQPQETILKLENISCTKEKQKKLKNINLEIKKGEIVAILGVSGNGQENLARVLGGIEDFEGRLYFQNQTYTGHTWTKNFPSSVSYIPEDRHNLGSVSELDLEHNLILTRLFQFSSKWFIFWDKIKEKTKILLSNFHVKAPKGNKTLARHLSGGNLQKFILARELDKNPQLIIAEQPTQGLDIQATEEVWHRLLAARKKAAILLITGDIKEALSLADKIAIIFQGEIKKLFSSQNREEISKIGLYLTGAI